MNSAPALSVQITMARGMVRVASLVSSDSVETASNPRKERHRMAAPAATAVNWKSWEMKGCSGLMLCARPEIVRKLMIAKVITNSAWMPTSTLFSPAAILMPMTLSAVTRAMATTMTPQIGICGRAALI